MWNVFCRHINLSKPMKALNLTNYTLYEKRLLSSYQYFQSNESTPLDPLHIKCRTSSVVISLLLIQWKNLRWPITHYMQNVFYRHIIKSNPIKALGLINYTLYENRVLWSHCYFESNEITPSDPYHIKYRTCSVVTVLYPTQWNHSIWPIIHYMKNVLCRHILISNPMKELEVAHYTLYAERVLSSHPYF